MDRVVASLPSHGTKLASRSLDGADRYRAEKKLSVMKVDSYSFGQPLIGVSVLWRSRARADGFLFWAAWTRASRFFFGISFFSLDFWACGCCVEIYIYIFLLVYPWGHWEEQPYRRRGFYLWSMKRAILVWCFDGGVSLSLSLAPFTYVRTIILRTYVPFARFDHNVYRPAGPVE